ncbi:MAG: QueT transporter family protein, partial [Lacticaseibacillus paracasei]|nr:QueT transporter family protein [Lacticaseibacillus paracasei]
MQTTSTTHRSIVSLAKTAMITSIYVVMTLMLSPLSFGVVQVRFSEMLNYTALFNRRYVWAVTLGVFFANFTSPTALLDVPMGT